MVLYVITNRTKEILRFSRTICFTIKKTNVPRKKNSHAKNKIAALLPLLDLRQQVPRF